MITFFFIIYAVGFVVAAVLTKSWTNKRFSNSDDWMVRFITCALWFIVGLVIGCCWLIYKFFKFVDKIEIKVDRKDEM